MSKIDFDHWLGSQIGYILIEKAENELILQTVSLLKPRFYFEGNQYCFELGDSPKSVCGYGDTVIDAARDFHHNVFNEKIKFLDNGKAVSK